MTEIAHRPSSAEPALHVSPLARPAASSPPQPAKLDWSKVAPPKNLESARVEELSIDGICGVY